MSARAPKFKPPPLGPVRPARIRVVRGESWLGRRRVVLVPAQIFADDPPGIPRRRALALMTSSAWWLTNLSLVRPLVLQPSATVDRYTIVAGLETWWVALAVGPRAAPVAVYGYVLDTPHEDPEPIAALLRAISTGMTTRTPRGTIARKTRALLDRLLDKAQRLRVAEVSDLHGISRQALWDANKKTGTDE